MFDYEIKYQKDSTNVEADMLFWSLDSKNISHHIHFYDFNETKEVKSSENIIANVKKKILK